MPLAALVAWIATFASARLFVVLLDSRATAQSQSAQLTTALTSGAALAITVIALWYAIALTALAIGRLGSPHLLAAVRHLGPPAVRRLAVASLAAPIALGAAPAFAATSAVSEAHTTAHHAVLGNGFGPQIAHAPEFAPAPLSIRATPIPASPQQVDTSEAETSPAQPVTTTRATAVDLSWGAPAPTQSDLRSERDFLAPGLPTTVPQTGSASARIVTVLPGDCLWSIAQRLSPDATDSATARIVGRLWESNREAIGPNPDLILPGQELIIPNLT